MFPHRYDYIYANYPGPGQRPQWQTESRHPLSDRLIRHGHALYGVRFGTETQYCLLDIDKGSTYHPQYHPHAFARVIEIFEDIGLVSHLICISSNSGGVHVYFPFETPHASWQLGHGITRLLESKGIAVKAGQLEVFPNARAYAAQGKLSLFNAHRLPLQQDSYLLNANLEPVWSSEHAFVNHWQHCRDRNILDTRALERIVKQHQHRYTYISTKADKFLGDLNAEIEAGWTGYGQTNRLLGRIAMRTYIFQHVTDQSDPLVGEALAEAIVKTAISLPGYREWCRHQHEINDRAAEWARCVETSHYFPYGQQRGRYKAKISGSVEVVDRPNWNQQRAHATQEKIKQAVADLIKKDHFPAKATARFKALLEHGIGGASLYRYRYLWHPENLLESDDERKTEPVSQPPELQNTDGRLDCAGGATNATNPTSLLSPVDSNVLAGGLSRDLEPPQIGQAGSNSIESVRDGIRAQLNQVRLQHQQTCDLQYQAHQIHLQQTQQRGVLNRMDEFVRSQDPILMAEAGRWLLSQSAEVQQWLEGGTDRPETAEFMEEVAIAQPLLWRIAKQFARLQWPAWRIRELLVQQCHTESLVGLTRSQKQQWLTYLTQQCQDSGMPRYHMP
ncbi:MAG: hypothetical protein AAFV72_16360 [Cyanobacteria bacterium J06635_1]